MVKLVILDADGVLFDSAESNVAYYNAIFGQLGEPPLSPEEERIVRFMSAGQVFELRTRANQELLARMREVGRSLDFAPFFRLLRPPFKLRPFLLELKRHYRLALATNRSATIPAVLEYLDLADVFDAVASARDQVRPKPAPDILLLCLERAGKVQPTVAVYVGDSDFDRLAALAAGLRFIGVGPGVEHNHHIGSLADLPAALEHIGNDDGAES